MDYTLGDYVFSIVLWGLLIWGIRAVLRKLDEL